MISVIRIGCSIDTSVLCTCRSSTTQITEKYITAMCCPNHPLITKSSKNFHTKKFPLKVIGAKQTKSAWKEVDHIAGFWSQRSHKQVIWKSPFLFNIWYFYLKITNILDIFQRDGLTSSCFSVVHYSIIPLSFRNYILLALYEASKVFH